MSGVIAAFPLTHPEMSWPLGRIVTTERCLSRFRQLPRSRQRVAELEGGGRLARRTVHALSPSLLRRGTIAALFASLYSTVLVGVCESTADQANEPARSGDAHTSATFTSSEIRRKCIHPTISSQPTCISRYRLYLYIFTLTRRSSCSLLSHAPSRPAARLSPPSFSATSRPAVRAGQSRSGAWVGKPLWGGRHCRRPPALHGCHSCFPTHAPRDELAVRSNCHNRDAYLGFVNCFLPRSRQRVAELEGGG